MTWYLLEGINIQRSHPKEREYETFWIMIGDHEVAFKRDTFSNLWYFERAQILQSACPAQNLTLKMQKPDILITDY